MKNPRRVQFTNGNVTEYVYSAEGELETEYDGSDRRVTVFWEPRKELKLSNGGKQSPATRLEHEFDHAVDDIKNHKNHADRRKVNSKNYYNAEEKRVIIGSESETARKLRQGVRYDHKGTTFDVIDPRYIK